MRIYVALVVLTCLINTALASETAQVHQALKETGRHQLNLLVGAPDQQTILPITVVTGSNQGRTLLVLAGVHGSEYAPIVATQRLAVKIAPGDMSGSVIFVHIANLPAYLGRTVYTSPVDGKNLNRLFPGNENGGLSERIAYTLSNELYPLADALLDVHSGDGNEDLRPFWTGYYANAGDADVVAKSKAMAHAFGLPYVVEFQWELKDPRAAIWAGSSAVASGIPSIDVEAGGMGIIDEHAVNAIEQGILRTMAHLSIIDQKFSPPKDQTLIKERHSVKSPEHGSWVSLKAAGQKVSEGELLGYVTDWHGRRIFDARAPIDGLLLLRLSAPPVRKGETLAIVAAAQ